MTGETETPLQRSLDAIDRMRRRILTVGWFVVVATLAMYARLAYLHRTTDNLEPLLGGSVAALTFLIAWATFAIVLTITRATKRILRAIELSAQTKL